MTHGPKATNGYNSYWRDHYSMMESLIAREHGITKSRVMRRDVTARIKQLWDTCPETEKASYQERDQR